MRVLVTRAWMDAERTGAALEKRGYEPVIIPLTTIRGTGEPPPFEQSPGERFDAIIVTSLHGAPYLARLPRPVNGPVFAVGPRTAEAVREVGTFDVVTAEGDAVSMIEAIRARMPPGTSLLHIAGRDRKLEPDASLIRSGFSVSVWPAYEAVAEDIAPAGLIEVLNGGAVDAVLHYSRRSSMILAQCAERAGLSQALFALRHVFLSQDVAQAFPDFVAKRSVIAVAPSEACLFDALDDIFRKTVP